MNAVVDHMQDLLAFPDDSRVWIYQSPVAVDEDKASEINRYLQEFAVKWTSHNRALHATAGLLHDRFLVLVVNESDADASGCSIDASVRFIQQLNQNYGVDFMDRTHFAYLDNDEVMVVHKDEFEKLYRAGNIDDSTLVFDNLVRNKGDFVRYWVKPLGESWMKRFV
jgi:hypothetical protein